MFPKSAICKIQHVPSTEDPKAVQEINIGTQPDGVVKRVFEVSLFQDPQNHPKGLRGSKPYVVCKKIELQTRYLEAVAMGHYGPILTALSHQCVRSSRLRGMEMWQSSPRFHDLTWIFGYLCWAHSARTAVAVASCAAVLSWRPRGGVQV